MVTGSINYGIESAQAIRLPDDEIHIWGAELDVDLGALEWLTDILAPQEYIRAKKYLFIKDFKRYIAARGILRILLGRYSGIEPRQIPLTYNDYGKPMLGPDIKDHPGITFNISHSGSYVLLAFAKNREIGVDIEQIHDIEDMDLIVKQFFSLKEHIAYDRLPVSEKRDAFFRCWTRKEAYIKARGRGLYMPLDKFSVTMSANEEPAIDFSEEDGAPARRWSIHSLSAPEGYASALAAEGSGYAVKLLRWEW